MELFIHKGTEDEPEIILDEARNIFAISGISTPEDGTYLFDNATALDAGSGYDTLVISNTDGDINFDTATIANIQNIEAIDLEDGTHNITISLDDVLDMTEEEASDVE